VRKAGNSLRITAQLIDALQDTHLWAQKYSGTLDDVFDIQEKVSLSIADALQLHLTPDESDKIAARPIDDIQAYECFRQARQDIWDSTEESLDRAIQRIKNGLNIIGDNELLYAALGSAHIQYMEMAYRIDETQFRRAEDCVSKVFELNPDSSFGHILRGRIEFKRGKTQSAVQEIKKGLSLDPNNDEGLSIIPFLYAISGKPSAAKFPLQRLKEIDPLSSWNYGMRAWVEILDGRFAPAVQSFKSLHQTDPGNPLFRYLYAVALAANREIKDACALVELIVKDSPAVHFSGIGTFLKHAWLGEKDQALKAVNPGWTESARFDETFSWHTASGYALIQMNEEALDWLENSVNKGVINYPFFSEYCHWFVNLYKDAGFIKLMKRVKREWENFEV
jgi:tetratricopeptide (TPR) repeat protein